jgi:MoxR-like ATPase
MVFDSIENVIARFAQHGYLMDRSLATTVFLSFSLRKPLFLEGEPGVGKTELAKVMALALGAELIRLQCHEGLDINTAAYEWNYPGQMLEIRLQEARGVERSQIGEGIYSPAFLLERPLLKSIRLAPPQQAVLLIDEIDRSDEEFEAYLLELLSDFQISIPEIGTVKACEPPFVVLTSNRTRALHDALKRRCLYHWIDYPDFDKEVAVVRVRVPDAGQRLTAQICRFMQWLREQELQKHPGVAETVDWAQALLALGVAELDGEVVRDTLGCFLKYRGDIDTLRATDLSGVLGRIAASTHND